MEDREIIQMFFDRLQAAIRAMDRKYGACCRKISYNVLRNFEDSEECVSDSYLRLWNSIPPHRPENLGAYLYRVVRNVSIMRLRERQALKRGGGETALILDELRECIEAPGRVEDRVMAGELKDSIHSFVLSLPEKDRLIFTGRYWLNLSLGEIAKARGLKPAAVSTSLFRSREKLKKHLIKEGLL